MIPVVEVLVRDRAGDAVVARTEPGPGGDLGPPPEYDITGPDTKSKQL